MKERKERKEATSKFYFSNIEVEAYNRRIVGMYGTGAERTYIGEEGHSGLNEEKLWLDVKVISLMGGLEALFADVEISGVVDGFGVERVYEIDS